MRKLTSFMLSISMISLLCLLGGCESGTDDEEQHEMASQAALGGPWFVEYIGDRPVIDNSPANIEFGDDETVSGSASCNRFTGSYEMSGAALKFGMLAVTERACIGALAEQETRFLATIPRVASWKLENDLLYLLDADGASVFRAAGQNAATVTGTALYRQRIAMPEGAVFEAVLLDVSRMDVAATKIGSTRIENPGNVPIAFEIAYDPTRIDERMSYSVRATIHVGDRLWATTDQHYPVLTGSGGNEVELLLQLVGPPDGDPEP